MKSFFTAINCIDGRAQLPVINYIQNKFNAAYVDMITEAGPNLILAEHAHPELADSIFSRVDISVEKHNSKGIVIAGHHDCAGNPALETKQRIQLRKSLAILKYRYPQLPLYAVWIDENLTIVEVT